MRFRLQILALALFLGGVLAAHAGVAAHAGALEPPAAQEALERLAVDEPAGQAMVIERSTGKPSGFWTSTRPARGGAYRYRLLGIGVGLIVITGAFMIWLVRRQSQRA